MKYDPKTEPPPAGVEVVVCGTDYMGDFWFRARRVDYKQPPNVACFRDGATCWRFVDPDGRRIDQGDCSAWQHCATTMATLPSTDRQA